MTYFKIVDSRSKYLGGRISLIRTRNFPKVMSREKAINLGIEKWAMIVAFHKDHPEYKGPIGNGGMDTCALCHKYELPGDAFRLPLCTNCPIFLLTQESRCKNTALWMYVDSTTAGDALFYAQKMQSLLISLL